MSMKFKWDYSGVDTMCFSDNNQESYKKSAEFLGDTVEDWGCGTGWSKRYFKDYKGVDGSPSKIVNKEDVVDLVEYTSNVDNILLRHVLECSGDWSKVLTNAINSFKKKLCIVISSPLVDETHINDTFVLRKADNTLPDEKDAIQEIFFNKQDILDYFPSDKFKVKEELINTQISYGEEWILYVEKIHS